MKKLVIFDLDGTLCDTTLSMMLCGNATLEKLSLPTFARRDYARFSGGGIEGYVNTILEAAGDREHKNFDRFWQYYLKVQETLPDDAIAPYEGIVPVLEECRRRGVLLAVLSNKDQASCEETVLRYFDAGLFDCIRGDRGVGPVKPDPTGVFDLMREFGVSPADCLYVGDTEIDMETGVRADVPTVAALWGYRDRELLEAYKPAFFAERPMDLLPLLDK